MDRNMKRRLLEEIKEEDISEKYRDIVGIIGIECFVEMSEYAKGDKLYFPKVESILAPARNPDHKAGIRWLQYQGAGRKIQPYDNTDRKHIER